MTQADSDKKTPPPPGPSFKGNGGGIHGIRFRDLVERENDERGRLARRLTDLRSKIDSGKTLHADEQAEYERILRVQNVIGGGFQPLSGSSATELCDPLFVAARDVFNSRGGLISGMVSNFSPTGIFVDYRDEDIVTISLVLGFLSADGAIPPQVNAERSYKMETDAAPPQKPRGIHADDADPAYPRFVDTFYQAVGAAARVSSLALLVLPLLAEEGDSNRRDRLPGGVSCLEFARVMRCLESRGVSVQELQLRRRINECLNKIQNVGGGDPITDGGISLPDLNEVTNYQIQADNVRLMGPIVCSAMFEELKVFQVLDKLVELSQNGMLPIGAGEAGKMLYRYWKETPNRISESERHNIYAMTLGIPGGEGGGTPNREFNDLWLRFISAISSLVRQRTTDSLLRANLPAGVNQQQVRKAARDLALNLSSRGYGMTYYLAIDLQAQINMIIALLSDREIMAAYGARDMWQVIDQVATLELGGARNSARYRTLATCGAIITAWLANNVARYNKATSRAIIDLEEVMSLEPPTSGPNATKDPTDYDLVNACELWLADTATPDQRIEELSQPREAPMMTSRPVQIPAIAREMLEQAGVAVPGFGLGAGIRRQ